MKRITSTWLALTLGCLLFAVTMQASAQEWSAAQKEVWKNVEAYWALAAAGNLEGFMGYFHNDYIGWSNQSPLPGDKSTARKYLDHDFKTSKTVVYDIKPVAISVMGNFAFADYYYSQITKDMDGKEKPEAGRWTDILMKQGDKWVMIGDHGGRTSKE
jgi:ketosteroid isomerase-like protein